MVVAEVKFRRIAGQMGLADVVIDADDPALEDREEILDRVRVPALAFGGERVVERRVVDL